MAVAPGPGPTVEATGSTDTREGRIRSLVRGLGTGSRRRDTVCPQQIAKPYNCDKMELFHRRSLLTSQINCNIIKRFALWSQIRIILEDSKRNIKKNTQTRIPNPSWNSQTSLFASTPPFLSQMRITTSHRFGLLELFRETGLFLIK